MLVGSSAKGSTNIDALDFSAPGLWVALAAGLIGVVVASLLLRGGLTGGLRGGDGRSNGSNVSDGSDGNNGNNGNNGSNTKAPLVSNITNAPLVSPSLPASYSFWVWVLSPFLNLTFLEFALSPLKMVTRCQRAYGPVFTMRMFGQRLTFLVGPEAQEPFFKSNDATMSQQEVYGFMKSVFGKGVVYDCEARKRQTQFQSMAHGLRASRLKTYTKKIEEECKEFLGRKWGQSGEIDLLDTLSELTILTASRCLHGDDVRENMYERVAELYHDLDQGVQPLSVFFPNAPTREHWRRDRARKKMVELFSGVIKKRRAESEEDRAKANRTDILQVFMETKYKDGTPLSDDEVTGLLIALLFAGQHTSSITSTWTAMFVAHDRSIFERVVKEQADVASRRGPALDYDAVGEMDLLHNCMREALRMHPPLVLLMRKCKKDVEVRSGGKSFVVPGGDTVLVSPSVGMRLPDVFKDPNTFDPDRYAEGREEHKIPYAYLGFGGGMHSCMGQNFAFVQVKTILAVIFRNYEVEMIPKDLPECDYEAMVVGPKGDCRIRYKKRNEVIGG